MLTESIICKMRVVQPTRGLICQFFWWKTRRDATWINCFICFLSFDVFGELVTDSLLALRFQRHAEFLYKPRFHHLDVQWVCIGLRPCIINGARGCSGASLLIIAWSPLGRSLTETTPWLKGREVFLLECLFREGMDMRRRRVETQDGGHFSYEGRGWRSFPVFFSMKFWYLNKFDLWFNLSPLSPAHHSPQLAHVSYE